MFELAAGALAEVAGGEAECRDAGLEGIEEGFDAREDLAAARGERSREGAEVGVEDGVDEGAIGAEAVEDAFDDGAVGAAAEANAGGSIGDAEDFLEGGIEGSAADAAGGDEGAVDIEEDERGHAGKCRGWGAPLR